MDPEREQWILERLVRLPSHDGEYRALWADLLYDYTRSHGDRAARQKLDRALDLCRELLDEKVAHELRQIGQRLRPEPPQPRAPTPSQPPPSAASAKAREQRERAGRGVSGCWPHGDVPDKRTLTGPRLCQKVEDWLKVHDPALPLPSPSTMIGHEAGGKETRTLVRHYVRTDLIERKVHVLRSWDERLQNIVAGREPTKVVRLVKTG